MTEEEAVSAFAIYSGKAIDTKLLSKKQIRRRKLKEKLKMQSVNQDDGNKKLNKVTLIKQKMGKLKNNSVDEKRKLKKLAQKQEKMKKMKPELIKKQAKNKKQAADSHNVTKSSPKKIGVQNGILPNGRVKTNKIKKKKIKKTTVEDEAEATVPNKGEELLDNSDHDTINEITKEVTLVIKTTERPLISKKSKTPLEKSSHFANREKSLKFKSPVQQMKARMLIAEARQIAQSETGSDLIGKRAFQRLIAPKSVDDFMSDHWEKSPLYISGNGAHRFENLISTQAIDRLLRYNVVMFGKHIDVTSYTNGVRETLNPEGRAQAHVLWDYFVNGCSIRLLNPQYFLGELHTLLATLQEYFGCFVGSNAYLTPPNSQGFAPHYDDIEAFVYQVEGKKHWRIYKPRSMDELLPRFSSPNYREEDVGKPIMEVTLSPGDVLYFPRGYIHQANTVEGEHSLHVTISTYQKTAWIDLLEKAVPRALKKAAQADVRYRKGLPLGYLTQAGLAHPRSFGRKELVQGLKTLVSKLEHFLDVDSAVDELGVGFMHDALPPVFSRQELECSVYNGGLKMSRGCLANNVQLKFESKIRLLRAQMCRMVQECATSEEGGDDHQIRLYYTVDNSREYHAEEPQYLILPVEMLPAVHFLIGAYPGFVRVSDLPCNSDEAKITLASDLWDRGLLMTDVPLTEEQQVDKKTRDDDDDDDELNSPDSSADEAVV